MDRRIVNQSIDAAEPRQDAVDQPGHIAHAGHIAFKNVCYKTALSEKLVGHLATPLRDASRLQRIEAARHYLPAP